MQARHLTQKESKVLAADRDAVELLLRKCGRASGLTQSVADLPTLQSLLREPLYYSAGSSIVASLGTAFGDVLASQIGLEWVMVIDKLGSDHALQLPGRHIFVFPRSMLLKRIGRGERLDEIHLDFMLGEIRHGLHAQAAGASRGDP